jgi:hypothetical protein
MTSLTFYGGVNEIGGNKILLRDKDTESFWILARALAEEPSISKNTSIHG